MTGLPRQLDTSGTSRAVLKSRPPLGRSSRSPSTYANTHRALPGTDHFCLGACSNGTGNKFKNMVVTHRAGNSRRTARRGPRPCEL